MPTLVSKVAARSLAIPFRKTYSTGTVSAFKNGKYAEFLAAAANLSSIPSLHGLPEVSRLNEKEEWQLIVIRSSLQVRLLTVICHIELYTNYCVLGIRPRECWQIHLA